MSSANLQSSVKRKRRHPETCGTPSQDGEICNSPRSHIGPHSWARVRDWKRLAAHDLEAE